MVRNDNHIGTRETIEHENQGEHMNTEAISEELHKRIEISREWLASSDSKKIHDLTIRRYPCTATAMSFIDDPNRKERHGIMCKLEFTDKDKTYRSNIEVRIMPDPVEPNPDSSAEPTAYVVIYVLGSGGAGDAITWYNFSISNLRKDVNIEDWYRVWIQKALDHKKSKKVFEVMREVQ